MINKLIQITMIVRPYIISQEFNFYQRTEELFDADATDEYGNRSFFTVKKEHQEWIIGSGVLLPDWVKEGEAELAAAFSCAESIEFTSQENCN
ncbi:MAG: hypothetical protein DI535_04955 [Citrobacter freundii]|nr:MAG: hypothetical protein DI535_04955 [Citrobacter freundii]